MKDPSPASKRKWTVTVAAISEATGRNAVVVRRDITKGVLKPWNLLDLSLYVIAHYFQKHLKENSLEAPPEEKSPSARPVAAEAAKPVAHTSVAAVERRKVPAPALPPPIKKQEPDEAPKLEKRNGVWT